MAGLQAIAILHHPGLRPQTPRFHIALSLHTQLPLLPLATETGYREHQMNVPSWLRPMGQMQDERRTLSKRSLVVSQSWLGGNLAVGLVGGIKGRLGSAKSAAFSVQLTARWRCKLDCISKGRQE